jgi:hypothetical protein
MAVCILCDVSQDCVLHQEAESWASFQTYFYSDGAAIPSTQVSYTSSSSVALILPICPSQNISHGFQKYLEEKQLSFLFQSLFQRPASCVRSLRSLRSNALTPCRRKGTRKFEYCAHVRTPLTCPISMVSANIRKTR